LNALLRAFQAKLKSFKRRKFAGWEGEGVKKLILGIFARYKSTAYSRKNDRF